MLELYFLMMAEAMRPSKYLLDRLMSEHSLAECLAQSRVFNKCQLLPGSMIMCLCNGKQQKKKEVGVLVLAKMEKQVPDLICQLKWLYKGQNICNAGLHDSVCLNPSVLE